MAKYSSTVSFAQEPELGSKGLVVSINTDNQIMGHLMVGKASLVWFEKNGKKQGRKVSWDELQKWFLTKPLTNATRP
jgi:hypothetical protein